MWALLREADDLTERDVRARAMLRAAAPVIAEGANLGERLLQLIRPCDASGRDPWLDDAGARGVAALRRIARGLRQDYATVRAALEVPHSNGQLEGQINRLQVIKRVRYGRAKFDLVRKQVLAVA